MDYLLLSSYLECLEVPNGNRISCCNSSLLECSPAVQEVVGSNHGLNMSVSVSIVEDGALSITVSIHL
jgi:hypothetical protein